MHTQSFTQPIFHFIRRNALINPRDRVLVAFSGGPDSTALLLALALLQPRLKCRLEAVYLDHGLRPAAVKKEKLFVSKIARQLELPVHLRAIAIRRKKEESLETAARRLRYEALIRLAKQRRCKVLAMAHTADDQAETVLIRLLRGAGTAGLGGIAPLREQSGVRFIRPLLSSTRAEVESFLKASKISACRDLSNLSEQFLRNKIRRRLLPLLEKEYNPQLRRKLAELAETVQPDIEFLRQESQRHFKKIARVQKKQVIIRRGAFRKLHPALRHGVLRAAVEALQQDTQGFRKQHWDFLAQALLDSHPVSVDLPHSIHAEIRGDLARFLIE